MPWKKNKRLIEDGFADLAYVPRAKCGWDCTLAAAAYAVRRALDRRGPDLAAWAARHALPASRRYIDLGPDAWVLWHGTSRQRADRIVEHGLFHKGGLWTAADPTIAHGFTRGRAERFAVEGAILCLVLDRRLAAEGRDYQVEGAGDVFRFHHGLPAEVVEYVLLHEEARFTGPAAARRPAPWPMARFKKVAGRWAPVQRTPVRYSESTTYSSVRQFAFACMDRLTAELGRVTALEVFSALYAAVRPWDALPHEDILGFMAERFGPPLRRGPFATFATFATSAASAPTAAPCPPPGG